MNIVLIGFMASGKSTIGHSLAKELGYDFVDTDVLIEQKAGKTIPEIFKDAGEDVFRSLETSVLNDLKSIDGKIISTGGGIIIKEENRKILKEIGKVVFLELSADNILARVKDHTTRPLINYDDPNKRRQVVEDLLEKRDNWYRESADFVIKTKTGDLTGDVQKILEQIKE